QVFKANPAIIELVRSRGALMGLSEINHSYPHCWRCHNPVIFRATEQWFISMETPMQNPDGSPTTFRQRTLDEIANVKWDPSWGQERISNMIATRPDWTISRQRIWGVPIAVFMCEKCHTPLNDPAINKSIVQLFHKEGADAWYAHDVDTLLPQGTSCASCSGTEFRKEMDILDVWFESGASWHAVLDVEPELHWPADLYTEGGDQHRGWFHSSILTSVAIRGKAPYKMVATSGWTLDEQGRAFSKSLGNGVDPVDIAKRLGGEIVRLWVASVDFREDVAASENLMQRVSENYRKLRNTFRFLLGNLHDFDPSTNAQRDFAKLEPLDQYILARLAELDKKIRRAYDEFEFHRAYHALNEFTNTDLSALYLDVLKDRLYTFAPNHPARRSAQTALWHIAETLTRLVAPILSFTSDEVWQSLPKIEGRESSVHLALFPALSKIVPASAKDILEDWQKLLDVRSEALVSIEAERKAGRVGKGLDASVDLLVRDAALSQLLSRYATALPELFNVSHVELKNPIASGDPQPAPVAAITVPASGTKCERCWRYTNDVGNEAKYPTVCLRCADALDAIGYPPYAAPSPTE
ncbi:MAG TPA: class I tRNA ligase family protein, partial [Edaphobacter sp.]|nr:class I tRNA ligase family protein [Edaphobacter sp.]